ncbi:MAG: hypothetical protein KKD24_01645, partial [Proteobacteria bacterium]|nr:hypothetical protein [Pseudomonadota bacterium]
PGDQPPAFHLGRNPDPLFIHKVFHNRSAAGWPADFSGTHLANGPFSFCSDLWILILTGMDFKNMDHETGGDYGNVAQNNHR